MRITTIRPSLSRAPGSKCRLFSLTILAPLIAATAALFVLFSSLHNLIHSSDVLIESSLRSPLASQQKSASSTASSSFVEILNLPPQTFSIVRLTEREDEPLVRSQSTVVTGYFLAKSKFPSDKYDEWMANMLSTLDPMVVFTEASLVDRVRKFRDHARNATVIVVTTLEELPITKYSLPPTYPTPDAFWQNQLDIDPERRIHKSYQLFWIWLSKTYYVTQAIQHNFFASDIFMYSDIGCYRLKRYNNQKIIQHTELIPKDRILWMAHKHIVWSPTKLWANKLDHVEKKHFYHSGSQAVGMKDTWLQYHKVFAETLDAFVQNKMFIGEDQTVLQSACMVAAQLCAYVPTAQVKDNNYFGLRYVLSAGGDYQYSYPPDTADESALVK
jgi:hypothetical protein